MAPSTSRALHGEGLVDRHRDGSGIPAKLRGNYGVFAVIEQVLYRPPSVTEKSVSASLPGVHGVRPDRLQPAGPKPD